MSKSSHTLKVTKGSTTYTCDLYTTTAEAKVYNSAYLPVTVDGTNLYAALYPTTYSQVFYDDYGTPVHIEKGGTEYVLATKSFPTRRSRSRRVGRPGRAATSIFLTVLPGRQRWQGLQGIMPVH